MKSKYSTKEIVLTGLGIAIVFCATMYIKIPNALQGYFNLGDGFILLFSSFLAPLPAFLVGGLGSALADLAGGYAHYFFPTLIIKGLEAIIVAILMNKCSKKAQLPIYVLASIVMIFGYFLFKWYMKQSMIVALSGIPGNIFQAGAGILIAMLAYPLVSKVIKTKR